VTDGIAWGLAQASMGNTSRTWLYRSEARGAFIVARFYQKDAMEVLPVLRETQRRRSNNHIRRVQQEQRREAGDRWPEHDEPAR
jgi:hypothetical protein